MGFGGGFGISGIQVVLRISLVLYCYIGLCAEGEVCFPYIRTNLLRSVESGLLYKYKYIRFITYINRGTVSMSGKMEGEILSCVKGLKHPEELCGVTTILGHGFLVPCMKNPLSEAVPTHFCFAESQFQSCSL